MFVCGEGDCGLGIGFTEDNAVDAVFVGGETQTGVLVAVAMPLLPTEYRQAKVQNVDDDDAQDIKIAIPVSRSL